MEFKMNKTKYITLILFFVLGLSVFFIYKLNSELNNLITQTDDSKKFIAENSNLSQVNLNIRKDIDNLLALQEDVDKIYVEKDKLVLFMQEVEKMASDLNLNIQISNPALRNIQEIKIKNLHDHNIEIFEMNVEIFGNWNRLKTYLELIQDLPYSIQIDSTRLSLTNKEIDGEKILVWTLSFPIQVITK
jgi:hypothetical protein